MKKIRRELEGLGIGEPVAPAVFRSPEDQDRSPEPRSKARHGFQPGQKGGVSPGIENLQFGMSVEDRLKRGDRKAVIRKEFPVLRRGLFGNGIQVGPNFRRCDLHAVHAVPGEQRQNRFVIMPVPGDVGDGEHVFIHGGTPQ